MPLADKLVSSFLAFELDINFQSPVHNIRTNAIKNFEKLYDYDVVRINYLLRVCMMHIKFMNGVKI